MFQGQLQPLPRRILARDHDLIAKGVEIAIGTAQLGVVAPIDEFNAMFECRAAGFEEDMFFNAACGQRLADRRDGGFADADGWNIFGLYDRDLNGPVQCVRQLVLQKCRSQPTGRAATDNGDCYGTACIIFCHSQPFLRVQRHPQCRSMCQGPAA